MNDVVIIGSGPAGLSAAIYAKRAGFSALVIEKAPMSGGQIVNTYEVDNYPGLMGIGGYELAVKLREHAEAMRAEFAEGEVSQIRLNGELREAVTKDKVYPAKAVVIAAGAEHSKLGAEGEDRYLGKGVSYCAVCDGAFFRGKTVAVIGGGDAAAEDALFLAKGCKKVYLIHRRDRLRAAGILQERIRSVPNIETVWDTVLEKIDGGEIVERIHTANQKTGEKGALSVDGVFIAVGIKPQSAGFADLVQTDENGYIEAGEDCRTSIEGIYAAGDIRTKPLRQVVTAAADGANAIAAIQEYFLKKQKDFKS